MAQTFRQLARAWLRDQRVRNKPRTVQGSRSKINILNESFGDLAAADIDPRRLQHFISRRQKRVKNSSINADLRVLKAALRWGVKRNIISAMPCEIKLLKTSKRLPRIYSKEELRHLLASVSGRQRIYLLLARTTLARNDELLHLKWRDIDWEQCRVDITSKPGWTTKSHAERVTFIPESVLDELRQYRLTLRFNSDNDWVFQSDKAPGERLTTIFKKIRKAFKEAGIYERGKPLSHGLRHTGASEMIQSVDIHTLKEILGHSSVTVTEIYLHASDQRKKEAVGAIKL